MALAMCVQNYSKHSIPKMLGNRRTKDLKFKAERLFSKYDEQGKKISSKW
jgi:hypothetical protein